MKTLRAKPSASVQTESPGAAADKMHPVVSAFSRTMADGIRRKDTSPFYSLFASDMVFVFEDEANGNKIKRLDAGNL